MSKNAFKRHGIEHLSASTINTWIAQPALCLLKIAGIKDGEAGPAAWRGNAIDRVAAAIARKPTIERDELRNLAKKIINRQLIGRWITIVIQKSKTSKK